MPPPKKKREKTIIYEGYPEAYDLSDEKKEQEKVIISKTMNIIRVKNGCISMRDYDLLVPYVIDE